MIASKFTEMNNNGFTFHKQNDMQCKVLNEKLWISFLLVTCLLLYQTVNAIVTKGQ